MIRSRSCGEHSVLPVDCIGPARSLPSATVSRNDRATSMWRTSSSPNGNWLTRSGVTRATDSSIAMCRHTSLQTFNSIDDESFLLTRLPRKYHGRPRKCPGLPVLYHSSTDHLKSRIPENQHENPCFSRKS